MGKPTTREGRRQYAKENAEARTQAGGLSRNKDPETGLFTSKLNDEVTDKICQAIQAGAYPETAAAYAGVHVDSLRNWLRAAHGDPPNEECLRFAERVQQALATLEVQSAALVTKHAQDDWRAAAHLLERRFPERWGKVERLNLGNADGHPFRIENLDLARLTDDQIEQLVNTLRIANGDDDVVDADVIDLSTRRALEP